MKRITTKRFSIAEMIGLMTVMILGISVYSYAVTVPTIFTSDTTAKAIEVNENFKALVTAVTTLESKVANLRANQATLQSDVAINQNNITSAQGDISKIQDNSVLALDDYLSLVSLDGSSDYDTALFSGVNVQVHNGIAQEALNGLGNLIVGFNNDRLTDEFGLAIDEICSDGQYDTQGACVTAGEVWGTNHKTGSHNLIAGDENAYSSYGGVVFGRFNASNRLYAGVTGGQQNLATGQVSSVSGGFSNTASAQHSSVSGGFSNTASSQNSSVSGGAENTASGLRSSVSGGEYNTASGIFSNVSGGLSNDASGDFSSVSGGFSNTTSGNFSNVSGGNTNTASGIYSSVSGGMTRTAPDTNNWAAGSLSEPD